MSTEQPYGNCSLKFWGGIECTINRVNNSYFDQLNFSGHYRREGDIKLISELGIKTLRYPVLWEKHEPLRQQPIDWSFTTQRLNEIQRYGITPIAGLLHHGSGPKFTSLLDDNFPELFASYAGKVAKQFPWLEYYTPVNEPLTTARFSGLYGLWYPHMSSDMCFAKMLLNQVKGIVLAMKEIRKINPAAKLVQTEDLSKTYSVPSLTYQAAFENERRWLTYDLLCGKLHAGTSMWNYFTRLGTTKEALNFFVENSTPPDIMGFNYYITSERYLDDDLKKYPPRSHGGNGIDQYADVEAIRVNHGKPHGLKILLKEAWERYKLPMAITEAHMNAERENQLRWLNEIYKSCCEALQSGINIKAITFWSLFGAYGWNKLLTSEKMDYEPGAFDLRSESPRPTAIASFIKCVISEKQYSHTLTDQKGWWHQSFRFFKKECLEKPLHLLRSRPVIIVGKTGTLGQAFANICGYRNLPFILVGRDDLDMSREKVVDAFLEAFKPWAVINTVGYVKVDEAEVHTKECTEANTTIAVLLSRACKRRNISFVTFSSDLVFDGQKRGPYFEADPVRPLNVYGTSKAMAEKEILKENPAALIVRTSSFFGPWDEHNFAFSVLKSLSENKPFFAARDVYISPTYIPHLITCVLDLLIDGERGIWHLANRGSLSWCDLAVKLADKADYDSRLIIGTDVMDLKLKAKRPKNSVLGSQRGILLPSLDHAINSFFQEAITLKEEAMEVK